MRLRHPEVRFEVTDHCNAHCVMCPREKHDRAHGVMSDEAFRRSLDEVAALGAQQVVLTGFGEPTLDPNLEGKIEHAKSRGLRTYIITNGSALTERRARGLLEAGLDEMRVSFYGMSQATYGAVMRGLNFERTRDNLLRFLEIRAATGARCRVQLSYLVLPENAGDVDLFRDFWEPRVDFLEIWRPHNFGDGRDYRARTEHKRTCGRPANGPLQIQWDGTVVPCCYDFNNRIKLGNAFEQPVPEILAGERYEELRRAHAAGDFARFPYCDQCDQLLERPDALVYSNRHDLPPEEAVRLSNTDLFDLEAGRGLPSNRRRP